MSGDYDKARRRRDRRRDALENEELRHEVLDLRQAVMFLREALDLVRRGKVAGLSVAARVDSELGGGDGNF